MLKIVNVTKNFDDVKALTSINLDINEGDRVVIIGPSGCGKSTLLRCINGLEVPTSGKILYKGENTKEKPPNILRQKIGMVFQELNLFNHLTVMENITLAPIKLKLMTKEEAVKKGKELLETVKLKDKIDQYPDNLSGGEEQRVAIVRSLMLSPEILLFDEPTSALDPKTNDEVLKLMKEIASQGMTMIVVTHKMSFAKEFANRIIFMDKGRIIEEGSPNEIFEHPKSEELKKFLNKS